MRVVLHRESLSLHAGMRLINEETLHESHPQSVTKTNTPLHREHGRGRRHSHHSHTQNDKQQIHVPARLRLVGQQAHVQQRGQDKRDDGDGETADCC